MSIATCIKCGRSVQVKDAGTRPGRCCGRGASARVLCKDCRDPAKDFPQFHLRVNGADRWLSLGQAGVAYVSGWVKVELGEWVIEKQGAQPRRMTDSDRAAILNSADHVNDSE